ncbi:hypothetical protein ABBQ38_007589 [Trebouxia sp. C0009 RCD-2024]
MGKKAVDIQRGDLGKVLKTAAGFTVAGLGFLAARHGKAVARRQARSAEWQVMLHQNAANIRREELRASHAAKNQLEQELDVAHQCIDELLIQKKKTAQLLDDARAVDQKTIEDLGTDITTTSAESARLSGLVQQEGAAKEAAVNTGFQLRAQVDDLLQRLSTSVASQDAARHELCVYKQQRDAQAEVLSKEKAVLHIQLMRLQAGAAAESRRLAAEVNAEKAAREQVEQACVQLGMQLLDLQRQLKASETNAAAAIKDLDDFVQQRDAEREVLTQEKAVLHNKMASMEKRHAGNAAESHRLAAEVNAEKAARVQVEQACARLRMQLNDLQCQLRASQTREAAATSDLDESMEQTEEAWRELDDEKDAHHLTAARSEREVEAYGIALRQAVAELDQQRLEAVQQLTGKQALSHHGAVGPAYPARTLPAPSQGIPSFQPIKGAQTTWSVAALASAAFEARVRATHGHQGPFDMIKASFCSSNSGCKGLYRTFRGETIGLVGAGAHSSVY